MDRLAGEGRRLKVGTAQSALMGLLAGGDVFGGGEGGRAVKR